MVVLHDGDMLFAANPASAAVDARRSRSAGGAPPRSPTRSFVPYWVVLRRGRVAVPGASLGRGSRARLKRELNSKGFHFTELWSSPLFHSNFRKRSFCGSSSCAPLVSRVRASFEVDVCSVNRCFCVEDPFYGILFSSLLQGVCASPSAPEPPHAFRERPRR